MRVSPENMSNEKPEYDREAAPTSCKRIAPKYGIRKRFNWHHCSKRVAPGSEGILGKTVGT